MNNKLNTQEKAEKQAVVSDSSNRVLKLTLKKQWFEMILSGEKKEEYREIKDHWVSILCKKHPNSVIAGGDLHHKHSGTQFSIKDFDWVEFTNGYNKNSPRVTLECKGINISTGIENLGAEKDVLYFVIKIGYEIARMNCH
jgi:hypothetical protein